MIVIWYENIFLTIPTRRNLDVVELRYIIFLCSVDSRAEWMRYLPPSGCRSTIDTSVHKCPNLCRQRRPEKTFAEVGLDRYCCYMASGAGLHDDAQTELKAVVLSRVQTVLVGFSRRISVITKLGGQQATCFCCWIQILSGEGLSNSGRDEEGRTGSCTKRRIAAIVFRRLRGLAQTLSAPLMCTHV